MTTPSSKPVLVTGAAGFLGASLCEALLARGFQVLALDVGDPLRRLGARRDGLEFVRGDVRDRALVSSLVARSSRVAHLAAIVGVDDYVQRPAEVFDVNVEGARSVFDACLAHRVPVLFSSSSEIYGQNQGLLNEEAVSVLGSASHARWVYAVSKLAGEHLAFALGRAGLCFTVVRYFNVYGPLMDAPGRGRVLAKFLGALQEGKPLPLVDGGDAVRSFCWIDDAIEATQRLLIGLHEGASYASTAVNVGRCEPVTIRELAHVVLSQSRPAPGTVDVPGDTFFGPGFEEVPSRVPVVERLKNAVDYVAPTPLREGVRRLLEHWSLLREEEATVEPRQIRFVKPRFQSGEALQQEIGRLLASGRVTNDGPVLTRFEQSAARWLEVEDVVGVSSGAAALLLAARALGLERGRVVLPSFTYNATLSAFVLCGLTPVFCDVDPHSFTLDPKALERVLVTTPDVAAVVPVNVYGTAPDLAAIVALSRAAGARVVYDDSHGMGTEVDGLRVPHGPDATTFSLHATKTLPAVEGGLVHAPDAEIRAQVRRFRAHGLEPSDLFASTEGWNARLDEVRAAIALSSLEVLDAALATRRRAAERLEAAALDCGGFWTLQRSVPGVLSSRQNLAVAAAVVPDGGCDELLRAFAEQGVEARRYFHPPLHLMRRWAGAWTLPVTEALWSRLLCLPLHSAMDERDVAQVASALSVVAARYSA